jgi:hypothetical protein
MHIPVVFYIYNDVDIILHFDYLQCDFELTVRNSALENEWFRLGPSIL